MVTGMLPSAALEPASLDAARDEVVETLRALIRIPSVNPAPPDAPDGELRAARWIADALEDAGIPAEIHLPVPGRGSVTARLHGDGTGGEPLLLLSHLDVVPAPPEGWTHDPFAAELDDGHVWGRGAVDMKHLVAMQLVVMRMLAAEARDAGRNPATDPVPGLTRDLLFACTADEEAGGLDGIAALAAERPELLRASGAISESGAIATTLGGARFYPIRTSEKGYAVYRLTVRGTWGHGSMPRDDNAAVLASQIVTRLAVQGPPRVSAAMDEFLGRVGERLDEDGRRLVAALTGPESRPAELAVEAACDPTSARILRALLRDTVSPNIIAAGVKYNVIPGEATIEVDCRTLPGTTEEEMRATILERMGPELAAACDVDLVVHAPAVDAPGSGPLWDAMAGTLVDHDPEGVPVPFMVPFATDAKHSEALGVPTYGFSPLRFDEGRQFQERFHSVDERVRVDSLRWGVIVLYDVVRRFCA
jgi:acetylornithine deacetylase/succinyl-diaminopimelate desuccinylase-like protein